MDAEFVDFLDKKFQTLERTLRAEIQHTHADLGKQISELRESVNTLATAVDRFIHMHEKLEKEQTSIIADLNRIKAVLKEKLGVEL